jgi:hypothetical protein
LVATTVAKRNVPPASSTILLLATKLPETASEPPDSTNDSAHSMLPTAWAPAEWVTVMDRAGLITTLSLAPGNFPVLQFAVFVQSPLPPTQETVAARLEVEIEKIKTPAAIVEVNMENCNFMKALLFLNAPGQNGTNTDDGKNARPSGRNPPKIARRFSHHSE